MACLYMKVYLEWVQDDADTLYSTCCFSLANLLGI